MQMVRRRRTSIGGLVVIVALGSVTLSGCGAPPAPAVASLAPTSGPAQGGTPVTIVGSNLSTVTQVSFGTWRAPFTIVNSSELTTVAPKGRGTVDVTLRNAGTAATGSKIQYDYLAPPTITSISVDTGPSRGDTRLIVHGTGFSQGMSLYVGPRRAAVLSVSNSTTLLATTPAGFGTQSVRAVTSGGTSAANPRTTFRYRTTVLVIGDSLGIDLGWGFASEFRAGGVLSVIDDSVGSTGLVRSDFFNWPRHLHSDLRTIRPDVVVALFGANDQQAIETPHGLAQLGTRQWGIAYGARIRALASVVASSGATLLWVELPRMSPTSDLSAPLVTQIDRDGQRAITGLRRAIFVSTALLFETKAGRYTPYVRLGRHVVERGRQPDGVHLTPAGATAIDELVADALQRLG